MDLINWSLSNFSYISDTSSISCFRGTGYSTECLYQQLCPQFSHYFINMGIGIIIFVIALSWLKWWYLTKGYTKFGYSLDNPLTKWFGNIYHVETRKNIDIWINARIQKLLIGFIVVVVYLAISWK